jgi:competence protein ComEC
MFSLAQQVQKYPILQITVPLILGVCAGEILWKTAGTTLPYTSIESFIAGFLALMFVLTAAMFATHKLGRKYQFRWMFGTIGALFFFLLGALSDISAWRTMTAPWPDGRAYFEAVVTDYPQQKQKSVFCPVNIVCEQQGQTKKTVDRTAYLYFQQRAAARNLQPGSHIVFYTQLARPQNFGNPGEFDYAGFLLHKGIGGIGFVEQKGWHLSQHTGTEGIGFLQRLSIKALKLRHALTCTLRGSGLSADNLAVLSAMTLGEKSGLTHQIRDLYMTGGVSHILALSGLHLGIVYMVLNTILLGRWRSMRFRWVSQLIIIAAIWAFVLLTGFSLSLVRSAIMFTVLSIGAIIHRENTTINSLALAAFIIVLANPFAVFDVGFQLSFISVFSIVVLNASKWHVRMPKSRIPNYVCALFWTSLSAQLGTAPLVAYYFHRFPTYFLITNLWVIPLVTVLISVTLLFFAVSFWSAVQGVVGVALSFLVKLLNGGLAAIASLPCASIAGLYPSEWTVMACYVLLAIGLLMCRKRRPAYIKPILLTLLAMAILNLIPLLWKEPMPRMIFYNNSGCPAVHCVVSKGQSYLVTSRNDSVAERFAYINEWWMKEGIRQPKIVSGNYSDANLFRQRYILRFQHLTVAFIADDSLRHCFSPTSFHVDYLYIARGYKGTMSNLYCLFRPHAVVFDGSLGQWRIEKYCHESDSLRLPYHILSQQGALLVRDKN